MSMAVAGVKVTFSGESVDLTAAANESTRAVEKLQTTLAKPLPQTGAEQAMERVGRKSAEVVKLNAQQVGNLQFQLQDVAVGLASGQSPFTVMLQQGSQIAQSFTSGTGVLGALKAVGGGLTSFLTNPLNLAVVGAGLATTAIVGIASAVMANFPSANSQIEKHDELVRRIGDNWDATKGRMKAYSAETRELMLVDAKLAAFGLRDASLGLSRDAVASGRMGVSTVGGVGMGRIEATGNEQLVEAARTFMNSVRAGTPDILAFRKALGDLSRESDDKELLKLVDTLNDNTRAAADAEIKFRQNQDIIKGLTGDNALLNSALGKGTEKVQGFTAAMNGLVNGKAFAAAQQPFGWGGSAAPNRFAGMGILDLIGAAEGTDKGRGYNETLGYGAYTGGPVDLVTKPISEILQLQRQMLQHPDNSFNSSAVGRYQITRETLLDFMPKLGLSQDTIFSKDVQDKIALAIANAAGRDPERLRGRWQGFNRLDEGVIKSSFDLSAGQRSGVAQDIMGVGAKKDKSDDKAKEQALANDKRWAQVIRETAAAEDARSEALGRSAGEQARLRKEQELWAQAQRIYGDRLEKDKTLHAEVAKSIEAQAAAYGKLAQGAEFANAKIKAGETMERERIAQMDQLRGVTSGVVSTFFQAKDAGQSWGDSLNSVLDSLKQKAVSLLDTLLNNLLMGEQGTSDGGLLGGLGKMLSEAFTYNFMGGDSVYAKGAAFGGGVEMFAGGGAFTNKIVARPTMFRFGGKLGVMGEAGPEAIMPLGGGGVAAKFGGHETRLPLTRMGNGALGVSLPQAFASGDVFGSLPRGGGGGAAAAGGVSVNVNTHNYGGEKVDTKVKRNRGGGFDIDVAVGDAVNRHLARGGADSTLNERFTGIKKRTMQYG